VSDGQEKRRAWDGDMLESANKGENAYKATDASISIVAHFTPAALANAQVKGTEGRGGTSSRFLWWLVRSEKDSPGGDITLMDRFAEIHRGHPGPQAPAI
jgi:hypothetical protein